MSEKKQNIFTNRPTLAVRYQMQTSFYRKSDDEEPTLSSGHSADLRIDLVRAAIATALGIAALGLTMLFNQK